MWAEARKQEKKIRGILVDHKRRAERRREYYEKIKQDPAQFLQLSGRSCKLHIDHERVGPEPRGSIMPWQGNADILIDRFDVRAHLDYIAEVQNDENTYPEESKEMRPLNYERYRILIQNGFLKVKEEKFLRTIALEEKFGGKTYQQQKAEDDKKKVEKSKAAIGFTYEDSTSEAAQRDQSSVSKESTIAQAAATPELMNSESDDDFDDLDTVINFSALSSEQQNDLNSIGRGYFLGREDFIKYLQHEADEQENAKNAKAEEDEKSAFSGRKSRKERRILKEKRLAGRIPSPPSYATYDHDKKHRKSMDRSSSESSRSASPVDRRATPGKVEYITTFGEENTKRSGGGKDKKSKKRSKRERSSSSSSSSDDGRGKYRSKYRRKRRSSSSSSEDDKNGKSKVVEPPPPPPVKRYYGRKREDSGEEKLTEDEEEPSAEFSKSECSSYQMYSREASNVSIFKTKWTLQLACAVPKTLNSKFSANVRQINLKT